MEYDIHGNFAGLKRAGEPPLNRNHTLFNVA